MSKTETKSYYSSDYAGFSTDKHGFYYGYETTIPTENEDENFPWRFVVTSNETGKKLEVFSLDATELDPENKHRSDCRTMLMEGVARYLESEGY